LAAHVFYQFPTDDDDVIRDEIGLTTNETDRLIVCQAMQVIFSQPNKSQPNYDHLHWLEKDPELRKCWWDVSRIPIPKLKAAVLMSVSQFLDSVGSFKMYVYLGIDNSTSSTTMTTTTEWIYEKFIRSPLPELRIAAYTLWTTLIRRIPNGGMLLLGVTTTMSSEPPTFLEWLQRRETTYDARAAKYELVLAMHSDRILSGHATGGDDSGFARAIKKQVELGAHGMEPVGWDIMVE
jgi:hypothetical protein